MKRYEQLYAGFMAVFVTFVVLTNTVGVKLFTAFGIVLPVSIIWFPLTFLITDIVSEMYGARRARFLVIMGFCMSLLLLAFSLIGIRLPVASFYPLQEDYTNIFGPIWRLLFGSMAAYLLAQLIDVRLFHFWKKLTKGKHLWLRNNASTMISQFIDTFTVNTIFLYKNPTIFTGDFSDLMGVILGVYILKVAIAALDTPLCYLGVWFVERMTGVKGEDIS
ncbi:queuosine precursor transporter [candidate division KSB1 bacterium]|nr:queuosine precursor transporter [candidate division KSB1 bacterium]